MDWDINVFRGVITLVVMLGFLGVCFQAYRSKNRTHFEEAGNLPFAEKDEPDNQVVSKSMGNNDEQKVTSHE